MWYTLAVGILLFFSLPFIAGVSLVAMCVHGLPVLFRQKRIGLYGRPFLIYKFRSMHKQAEKEQTRLRNCNESDGPVFKMRCDPRYTPIGKFLAHTGLDELPQLYNVLRGEMALFGPRPLPIFEAKKLKPWQQKRHTIKPGILSPAILTGKYHENFDAWMKSDIAYTKEKSFRYDVGLALRALGFLARLLLSELSNPTPSPKRS